jgi:hypothetical protein
MRDLRDRMLREVPLQPDIRERSEVRAEDAAELRDLICLHLLPEGRVVAAKQTSDGDDYRVVNGFIGPNGRHGTLVTRFGDRTIRAGTEGVVLEANPSGSYLVEVTIRPASESDDGDFDQATLTEGQFEVITAGA